MISFATYSDSTAKERPIFLIWFSTRMKSNEDGTKMTVLVLCNADFVTEGSSCEKYMSTESNN